MKKETRARGRPKIFNETEVLDAARDLFWSQGYEGTSIKELVETMGISPPSLYASFGSKQALFNRVLDHYHETFGYSLVQALDDEANLKQAFSRMLFDFARLVSQDKFLKGCMVATGMIGCAASNLIVAQELTQRRERAKDFMLKRLKTDQDQLPEGTNLKCLSQYFAIIIQGMSVQAKDGADEEALKKVAELSMAAWPQ